MRWPNPIHSSTVRGMEPTQRDHFARIVTASGSVVVIPNLTAEQADDIAEQYGPLPRP